MAVARRLSMLTIRERVQSNGMAIARFLMPRYGIRAVFSEGLSKNSMSGLIVRVDLLRDMETLANSEKLDADELQRKRELALTVGVPGQLLLANKIREVLPLKDESALQDAKPLARRSLLDFARIMEMFDKHRTTPLFPMWQEPRAHFSEGIVGPGHVFFEQAVRQGQEGVMAKLLASRHLPGKRSACWLKIKPARGAWFIQELACVLAPANGHSILEKNATRWQSFRPQAREVPGRRVFTFERLA